jgi:hypothetical protein
MRRWSIAAAVAGLLALCVAVPVQAAAEWCTIDPELSVQTSPGQSFTVFVTEGVMGSQHLAALTSAKTSYTTRAVSKTSVLVTVYDYIPSDSVGTFATRMIVSSQPFGAGVLYGSAYGTSGTTMSVSFSINPEKVTG